MSPRSQYFSIVIAALIGILAILMVTSDRASLLRFESISNSSGCSLVTLLPEVDLGYAAYRASKVNDYNTTEYEIRFDQKLSHQNIHQFYNFSNIRYAAPPTGHHRFLAPQLPVTQRDLVQDGLYGERCVQAVPVWARRLLGVEREYVGREDCLFLDVNVPRKVFDSRQAKKVPVLVWIHGGGYVAGSKWQFGSGAGFLAAASEPIIYVTINYRVSRVPEHMICADVFP